MRFPMDSHVGTLCVPFQAWYAQHTWLLYTGITRASQAFTLVTPGQRDVLDIAIRRRVLRHGGVLASGEDD